MKERRKEERFKELNEITISVISEEKNISKKNSYITIAKISLYPVLKFSLIFFYLSISSFR